MSDLKANKIAHPQIHYATPDDLIKDVSISLEEKSRALDIWEQDARQMLTASGEGMPASNEGIDRSDDPMLGQIMRARNQLVMHSPPEAS